MKEREIDTSVPGIDFVVVTALREELDAVLNKLPGIQRLPPDRDDIRVYYRVDLPVTFSDHSTGTYRIIVMCLLGMGRVQAVTATTDAIRRWHPRYLLLVGMASGIAVDRNIKAGDILISAQVVDYELQRLTADGPEVHWEVHRADPRLIGACTNLQDKRWQELIQTSRSDSNCPSHFIGPIASGDKVIAFAEVLAKYRNLWPELIGVEMEAAGVATAAFQSIYNPGFFMVRGVAEIVDADNASVNTGDWRSYACDAAASFVVALLRSGPVPLAKGYPQAEQIPTVKREPVMRKSIAIGLVMLLIGILGNLLAAWVQKVLFKDSFTPLSITIIILLTILGIVIGARLENTREPVPIRKGAYWAITFLVIGIMIVTGLAVILSGGYQSGPSTIYFIVDATEKMAPIFDEVREQIQTAATSVREDNKIGLRIYGGDKNMGRTCQKSNQLLQPDIYPQNRKILDLALSGIKPSGHSSMTGAVLETLVGGIDDKGGPVKVILVTSGLDQLCDPANADVLIDQAKNIGKNVDFLIISIGDQDAKTQDSFENYAYALDGHYLSLENVEDLLPVVRLLSTYGYGYYGYGY